MTEGASRDPVFLFVWLPDPFRADCCLPQIWSAGYAPVGRRHVRPLASYPLNDETARLSLATLAALYPPPVRQKDNA